MSLANLFNKRATWRRKVFGVDNVYGEPTYTEVIKGNNVKCRVEDIEGWQIWRGEPGGDFSRAKKLMYLQYGADIQSNDRVTVDGSDFYVINDDNAAGHGHHLEVRLGDEKDI